MKQPKVDLHDCPVLDALEVFAGKWKVCILFELKGGPVRFNELRRLLPAISQKMMTQQLRQLEENGLVLRRQYRESRLHVEYSLTKLAKSVDPVLKSMVTWSTNNMKQVEIARKSYRSKQLKKDKI